MEAEVRTTVQEQVWAGAKRRRGRAALGAGVLVALLALSGCGAGGSDDSASADKRAVSSDEKGGGHADAASGAKGTEGARAASGEPDSTLPVTHVIRTATLSVQVKDVPRAVAAARAVAEDAGGVVAKEDTERLDDDHDVSTVVLRVPQEAYDASLRALAGAGTLLSRTTSAKDVTDQVVDVESRIATQRTSVARVRKLMDRAERISDVVALEGELSSRQAELESLLSRQASLKDRTTLATITLELTEPDAADSGDDGGPGFLDALAGGWHAFVEVLRWIALAIGAAAPFLALAAGALVLWRVVRRRRAGRAAASGEEPPRS